MNGKDSYTNGKSRVPKYSSPKWCICPSYLDGIIIPFIFAAVFLR
ncbi:hypothetical protein SAMN05216462_1032 [Xylanibacter ruminicola]|uniref:Uncharacterized protein n=1 Tax=Xylanibacter ruminicola TaxID=839 RepID=A0A1H4A461_XYLRU|nr:hypothetical protein SAMN05216462_1032 [Xylanibacter ruminicola]